jgi:hypothetical protein
LHRARLEDARAAGSTESSEVVLGSSLGVLASTWVAQLNFSDYITDRLAKTTTLFHHQVGIAGHSNAPYVDLPGNMISIDSQVADTAKTRAVFFSSGMHLSILESTAVQQTSGAGAVSTVKLIDIAATNNDRIYDAKTSNYISTVKPNLLNCSAGNLAKFQGSVNAGNRLILPTRCNIAENTWSGVGYFEIDSTGSSIGSLISGGYAGGYSNINMLPSIFTPNAYFNSASQKNTTQTFGLTWNDPIDMTRGHFLYNHEDMNVGVGAFPHALNFQNSIAPVCATKPVP